LHRNSKGFLAPQLKADSKESYIAEKLVTIYRLGLANSRMKDCYDLWRLELELEKVFQMTTESTTLVADVEPLMSLFRTQKPRKKIHKCILRGF